MGVHEICRWGSCTYTTTNNMFDVIEDADDLWTAADVVAEVVFGLDFVRVTHKWFGLGTALELYALWSVGYINDPDIAFSDFDT